MLTRKDILAQYKVENGRILSPGKFEGQQAYMPIFYEAYLDGGAEEVGSEVLSVPVTPEDKAEFPELKRRKRVRFIIDDQGFVREV